MKLNFKRPTHWAGAGLLASFLILFAGCTKLSTNPG